MKEDPRTFFQELKRDLTLFAALKTELFRLGAYERTAKVVAVLSYSLILLILTFFFSLFLFIALAFLLGDLLHSMSAGFAIVATLYLLITGGVVINRERLRTAILNTVISALMANENSKNESTEKENSAGETPAAQG
jgi:hypothetical protein